MFESKVQEICNFFEINATKYKLISHIETRTSEESSKVRAEQGFANVTGAKAILMKLDFKDGQTEFSVFVLPSHLKLNSKTFKSEIPSYKSSRFASSIEFSDLTGGLSPGSLPPFVKPFFPGIEDLFVDQGLLECDTIAFNVASLCHSIIMNCEDYIRVAKPKLIFQFSQDV